jgi:FdhD protein
MLNKARQMGIPVVVSHTSPTSLTVGLADAWNICVVGYVRQTSMRVYTHPERLGVAGDTIGVVQREAAPPDNGQI